MECTRKSINNTMDVSILKEIAKKDIVAILNKFPGHKTVVWDRGLVAPLNLVSDPSLFKENGVLTMVSLELGALPPDDIPETVLFLCRPVVTLMKYIVSIIQREIRNHRRKKFHLIFLPNKSLLCLKWLENQHVAEFVASIEVLPIYLFPLDVDLLTLEMESFVRDYYIDRDPGGLHQIAESLVLFQRKFGKPKTIFGKGSAAQCVFDLMHVMKDAATNTNRQVIPQILDSHIETLILVDRQVDLLSPLVKQLTYEGLIDEFFGINCNLVKFPEDKFKESKQIALNSSEDLFTDLRDQNFSAVGGFLRLKTNDIQKIYKQKDKAQSMNEMKKLVQQLPALNALKQSLSVHASIAELLKENTEHDDFLASLECEQELLNGIDVDKINSHIEALICKNAPFLKVLRLLLIQSITCNGGLRPKVLQHYERLIVQNYGFEKFLALEILRKAGYLQAQSSKYSVLRRALNLVVCDGSEIKPEDFSYVHSIYAPLSIRLVQHRLKPTLWSSLRDSLNAWIPGPTIDHNNEVAHTRDKQKVSVIVFIGGCTFAEISALRFLAKQEDWEILILTTGMINGNTFLNSLMETP